MKKIAILFGGCSTEYEVSLQSAHSIIESMDRTRYEVHLVGITREGTWFLYGGSEKKILENTWMEDENCVPVIISNSKKEHGVLVFRDKGVEAIYIDAIFPVLHGKNGEDGTVQGVCELAGIPVVGCGMLSSAICMDKDIAHKLVKSVGIRVPHSFVVKDSRQVDSAIEYADSIGYPIFVKPVKSGSSFGITKVAQKKDLLNAILEAFQHDNQVILEENIEGFEVGCAILGNRELLIGKLDEIELAEGFFDYTEKYTLKTSKIHMPARISDTDLERIQKVAREIYGTLNCSGFARVDMFLTEKGSIVFNEVNTIPGFTSHSRFPNMLKGAGFTFEKIINMLIEQAV